MGVLKVNSEKFSPLTKKQFDVLQLVSEGLTNSEIGNKLFISCRTVEGIRADLLRVTRTKNTAALITHCFRNGILV
ncbi:LuxR C-terminal-related transcriptional regulator [Pedobacter agri]|uniref:LuxR C-terminal-related transcriptional regulator n=1 Tax=Pedobacter agri TaxID=454586 RepID=UPI0039779660